MGHVQTIATAILIKETSSLYALHDYCIVPIKPHRNSRNLTYICTHETSATKIIRISYLDKKCEQEILAELEFVNYLANNGAYVSRAIYSKNKRLLETLVIEGQAYYISVFYKAKGNTLCSIEASQIPEDLRSAFFYQCGKTLGKLHNLSKLFKPTYTRYNFLDKYNQHYIEALLPPHKTLLKSAMLELLDDINLATKSTANYGLVHFNFKKLNFSVDMPTMHVTIFDFNYCCNCWYMYDLASLWVYGMHWSCTSNNVEERQALMEHYFSQVLEGYRSETALADEELLELQRFISLQAMVTVLTAYENMKLNVSSELEDEQIEQLIYCLEHNIAYNGVYDEAVFSRFHPSDI